MKEENQISELMSATIEKLKGILDTNTVVGVPFETKEGELIIPLTKVSVGFVTGGGEYGSDCKNYKDVNRFPFAGGSGAGATIQPVGLLTVKDEVVKLIRINEKNPYEKLIDTIPSVVKDISSIFKSEDKNEK